MKKKVKPVPTNRGRIPEKVLQGIILDLKSGLSDLEIAEKYNRPVEQIVKVQETHIKPFLLTTGSDKVELIQKFKMRPEWVTFNAEFSKEEMDMFLYEYCKLMDDFGEDEIKKAEENQLFMSIRYWILIHRNMKDRKKTTIELEELEKTIEKTEKAGKDHPDFGGDFDRYLSYIEMLESKRRALQSSQISKTTEHRSLTEKHQKFMEDLKVTRNQRIEKFQQKKSNLNFLDIIKELEEEENRKAIGLQMTLVKESVSKQEKEWGKITKYADNELDRPVLDSDTININEYAEDTEEGKLEIYNEQ